MDVQIRHVRIRGARSHTEAWRAYVQAVTTVSDDGQPQPPSDAALWEVLREVRNQQLRETDGALLRLLGQHVLPRLLENNPDLLQQVEQLEATRQNLRDLPASVAHPGNVVFPETPATGSQEPPPPGKREGGS